MPTEAGRCRTPGGYRLRGAPTNRMTDEVSTVLAGRRCPICGASDWLPRHVAAECSHCRLVLCRPDLVSSIATDVAGRLAQGIVDLVDRPADGWWTDDAGLRNLAWRLGYDVEAMDGDAIRPASTPARLLATRPVPRRHDVTLAIMARVDDRRADEVHAMLAASFDRRIILLDAAGPADHAARFPGAVVAAHPLAGDFAAQRNRLQAMVGTGWVLQIDTDEMPDRPLIHSLGWLTAAADRDGLRSLGLPRRNHVDGRVSALYPDIQYRLNRADVRFAGIVHERPVVPFAQTSLALTGAIDHRMDGARVRERTQVYETMAAGGGRPEDEALLLMPFEAIALR